MMILGCLSACQTTLVATTPLPTVSPTPQPAPHFLPTQTPRPIVITTASPAPTPLTLSADSTPIMLITHADAPPPDTLEPSLLTEVAFSGSVPLASVPLSAAPLATVTLPADTTLVGRTVEGRGILARRFGVGGRILLIVGGIHGGWESNTVTLMNELISHFQSQPEDIPAGVSLVIIPVANPDGLIRGRVAAGRFNADGVDLNRNWSCGWSPTAIWRQETVNPGARPFSEPETQALANYIQQMRPSAALFYHSAAGGVYAGGCRGTNGSDALAEAVGQATGYGYGADFSAYPVSGSEAAWTDGQGIPAADVELRSWTDSEYDRNLGGVIAAMQWLAGA